MGLYKISKYVSLALALIGVVFLIMILSSDKGSTEEASASGYIITIAYIVLIFIIALVAAFVLKGLFFGGNAKKTLLAIGLFLGVILISYLISTGNDIGQLFAPPAKLPVDATETASRYVGTGLYTFYILAFAAIVSMILFGVKKIFNK